MSSGNGGGKGFVDNLVNVESTSGKGNFFENIFADAVNLTTQVTTGGVFGFEDGKISNGVSTNIAKKTGKEVVSGLKEITGAKAAEDANKMARTQFEEAKAESEADRVNQQNQIAMSQIQQSQIAGAARSVGTRSTNKSQGFGSSSFGDYEKDFLGL